MMKLIKLNFIFSNLNAIVLGFWLLFLIIVAIRFFRPAWVKNISYTKLIFIAIGLNIFYGLFVTWGQYYVWSTSSDISKALLHLPLPKQVPFFSLFRPLFEHSYGYFLFYILGRVWLNILIAFLVSAAFYSLFRIWNFYRGGFLEQGPELLLVLMLISGLPGVLVSVSVGFIFAILLFIFSYFKNFLKKVPLVEEGIMVLSIEPAFIFATLFALLFTRIIFAYL